MKTFFMKNYIVDRNRRRVLAAGGAYWYVSSRDAADIRQR